MAFQSQKRHFWKELLEVDLKALSEAVHNLLVKVTLPGWSVAQPDTLHPHLSCLPAYHALQYL